MERRDARDVGTVGTDDAGIAIPADPSVFPQPDRLSGKHIAAFAQKNKNNKIFGEYKRLNADPAKLPERFEQVKSSILKGAP